MDTGKVTPQALSLSSKQANHRIVEAGYQPLSASITAADLRRQPRTPTHQSGPVQLTVNGAFPFDLVQGDKVLSPAARPR